MLLEAGIFTEKNLSANKQRHLYKLYWGGGIEFGKDGRMGFLRTKMVGGSSIVLPMFDG